MLHSSSNLSTSSLVRKHPIVSSAIVLAGLTFGAKPFASLASFSATPGKDDSAGRSVNAISTVIAGIVADKTEAQKIDLTIEKPDFYDTKVSGSLIDGVFKIVTDNFFAIETDFTLSDAKVAKPGWNWDVTQEDNNTWLIKRTGPNFDAELKMYVKDGKINGSFRRPYAFDWDFRGTYSEDGKVELNFSCPMMRDFKISGEISS